MESVLLELDGNAVTIRNAYSPSGEAFHEQRFNNGARNSFHDLRGVNIERLRFYVSLPSPRKSAGNVLKLTLPPLPTSLHRGGAAY
eukprot:989333-Rhodomonas_salina.1